MRGALVLPEHDPALLAFIKCHLTSMDRWNILRVLSAEPGYPWPVAELARLTHGSDAATRGLLEDLAAEGLVERYDGPEGPTYVLEAAEPTSRVLARLLTEAGRSQGLRQIIVARMLAGDGPGVNRLHEATTS
jgi:DNA-binding MarR family transcriptional regulator